ncbi:TIP-1 family-domain-containing protein [Zopfochytrium polystomum]|nr:TIP-1 family-domain-containing protein [Zopfochytrium polystomum]
MEPALSIPSSSSSSPPSSPFDVAAAAAEILAAVRAVDARIASAASAASALVDGGSDAFTTTTTPASTTTATTATTTPPPYTALASALAAAAPLVREHARLSLARAYLALVRDFSRRAAAAADAVAILESTAEAGTGAGTTKTTTTAAIAAVASACEALDETRAEARSGWGGGGGGGGGGKGATQATTTTTRMERWMDETVEAVVARAVAVVSRRLADAVAALGWPNPIVAIESSSAKHDAARAAFADALAVQNIVDKFELAPAGPVLPIQALLDAVVARMRFHFTGDRPTNKLERPEWLLQHILKTAKDHAEFLDGEVQDWLNQDGFARCSASQEFMHGLVLFARSKFRNDLPALLARPHLLSHAVGEFIRFDKRVLSFATTDRDADGDGDVWVEEEFERLAVVKVVTESNDVFKAWLGTEKLAAREKLALIMKKDPWSWADVSLSNPEGVLATTSSEALMDLIGSVTDRYRILPISHRILVLKRVQCAILDDYLDEIRRAVNAYESTFTPLEGGTGSPRLAERVTTVCRAACSLLFVRDAVAEMGETVFFLQMWDHLQRHLNPGSDPSEGIFADAVRSYDLVAARIQAVLVEDCTKEFVEAAWKYGNKNDWDASATAADAPHPTTPSPELAEAVDALSGLVHAVRRNLPAAASVRVLRELAAAVADHLWRQVVVVARRRRFSPAGGRQLAVDVDFVWRRLFEAALRSVPVGFRRLREACTILKLDEDGMSTLLSGLLGSTEGVRQTLLAIDVQRLSPAEVEDVARRSLVCERLLRAFDDDDGDDGDGDDGDFESGRGGEYGGDDDGEHAGAGEDAV